MLNHHRPQLLLRKGNAFISVCQEFCLLGGGGGVDPTRQTPPGQTPPLREGDVFAGVCLSGGGGWVLGISGPRSSLGGRSLWFHVLSGEGRLRYLWSQVPRGISGGGGRCTQWGRFTRYLTPALGTNIYWWPPKRVECFQFYLCMPWWCSSLACRGGMVALPLVSSLPELHPWSSKPLVSFCHNLGDRTVNVGNKRLFNVTSFHIRMPVSARHLEQTAIHFSALVFFF